MSDWAAKRFWKTTETVATDGGFSVQLDGRAIRTPSKAGLTLPTEALATALAAEWEAQQDQIDPNSMPMTRMANSAIDKVAPQHGEVADMLASYGDSDLLCYRATEPKELVARQAQMWDPLLDWAAQSMMCRLVPVSGIMHEPQDAAALSILSKRVHSLSNFELAAFHDLVTISGSLILGFATIDGVQPADAIWELSRLDDAWQQEQWGVDEEAVEQSELKRTAFHDAARFFMMCQG